MTSKWKLTFAGSIEKKHRVYFAYKDLAQHPSMRAPYSVTLQHGVQIKRWYVEGYCEVEIRTFGDFIERIDFDEAPKSVMHGAVLKRLRKIQLSFLITGEYDNG